MCSGAHLQTNKPTTQPTDQQTNTPHNQPRTAQGELTSRRTFRLAAQFLAAFAMQRVVNNSNLRINGLTNKATHHLTD